MHLNVRALFPVVILLCHQIYSGLSLGISKDHIVDLLQPIMWNQTGNTAVPVLPSHDKTKNHYIFKGNKRCVVSPRKLANQVKDIIHQEEFTFLAKIKQHRGNTGSLVSLTVREKRYFEIQSNGRKHAIRLYYRIKDQIHIESFSYDLADNQWHSVALSIRSQHIAVYIDCQKLYERVLPLWNDRNYRKLNSTLWLGQRNSRQAVFKGALEEIKFVHRPSGYLVQCPALGSDCPTCTQFRTLELSVANLFVHIEELNRKLHAAERKIKELSKCDCMMSCHVGGARYHDGQLVPSNKCHTCSCDSGQVKCRRDWCAVPQCPHPVKVQGECCPRCLDYCFFGQTKYEHGEGITRYDETNERCVQCLCKNGKMSCNKIVPPCPALDCPRSHQFTRDGQCCKYCSETPLQVEKLTGD